MRRPVLKRWLRRELMALSGLDRFSLRKMAAMAQSSHARLAEPLFLYCKECGQLEALLALTYKGETTTLYHKLEDALGDVDLSELALSGTAPEILPRACAKHLNSFAVDYRKTETIAESKLMRLNRCRALQLETGAGNVEICSALGLDPGNVCAFLKHGDLGRVTLKDATAIMKHLMTL